MSHRKALSCLFLARVAWPAAGAFAQAPLTRLYLQESASRDVEQNVLVATVQAHAESASPAEAQAAVNEAMAAAVERVRAEAGDPRRDRQLQRLRASGSGQPAGRLGRGAGSAADLEGPGGAPGAGRQPAGDGAEPDRPRLAGRRRDPAQGAGRAHHRGDRDAAPARRGDRRERRHAGRQHRHAAGRRVRWRGRGR